MDDKQKINCTVTSCEYNNYGENECSLKEILVSPVDGINTEETDESMCSSYKHDDEE